MSRQRTSKFKKVLITGGAGYIGSVMVPELLRRGYQVTVLDKLYFGRQSIDEWVRSKRIELIQMDIRDIGKRPEILKGYDAVIHLAALSNDPSCELNPEFTEAVNYRETCHLALLAREAGIPRFLFSSSCSVYGEGTNTKLREDSPKNPVSIYAASKLRAEQYLLSLSNERFHPTILRLATAFGLSPRMRFDLAINVMTLHGYRNRKIIVRGGGQQWRPFVHIRDIADAFGTVLESPTEKVSGEIFNVGSDSQNYRIADLADLVAGEIPGVELETVPDDPDKRNYNVGFDKIRKVLGFKTRHDARSGIREIRRALEDGTLRHPEDPRYYNMKIMVPHVKAPAVEGGEPTRRDFLPFALPLLGREEEEEVVATLRSGWITTGAKAKRFEEKLAGMVGAKHCLAVNSCTAALHLCLKVLGIGPGDEVITTPLTFAATANVIEHVGARPVFVDVDPLDWNLDVGKAEKAFTPRTRAIVPVHLAGYPCDLKAIHALARKKGIPVIEDAAHALGSEYQGRPIGALSDFTCFSFYPIKNATTIEGGTITTNNGKWMDRLRRLALHGLSRDAWKRYSTSGSPHAWVDEPGFKYNMTDIQAAVGLHQLDRLESFNRRRAQIAKIYDDAFSGMAGFERPDYTAKGRRTNHHLYLVRLRTEDLRIDRDRMLEVLKEEGIGTGIHYLPLHIHPYYRKKYGLKEEGYPRATDLGKRIFSLPLYPKMTDRDVQDVIRAFQKALLYYSRKAK